LRLFAVALSGNTLLAQPTIPTFSFHENGNGQLELPLLFGGVIPLPGTLTSDPGPGGLASALTFTAHPLVNPFPESDLVLLDASGHVSDILRFNPATSSPSGLTQLIFFYSNDHGGLLADTSLPSLMYDNTVTIQESQSGPTTYTPIAGQPGSSSDSPLGDTFHIFSTPDTGSTLLMFGAGVGFLGACPAQDFGGSKLGEATGKRRTGQQHTLVDGAESDPRTSLPAFNAGFRLEMYLYDLQPARAIGNSPLKLVADSVTQHCRA
jgi:hypothetical protein